MKPVNQRIMTAIAAVAMVGGGAVAGSAQPALRPYVGAAVGSFSVDADDIDGRSASAALLGGLRLSRLVDVEVEATFPTQTFDRSATALLTSFAPPGASRDEIERLGVVSRIDRRREVTLNISAVAIIHPAMTGRVVPGLVAGVTNQRARSITHYTPVSIPAGVNPQHPSVVEREERSTRNIGAPTIGGQVSIRVAPHFFVVPDLRYDYGSIGDEINNALRMSVRGIWRF
jgi:hypothetical protein